MENVPPTNEENIAPSSDSSSSEARNFALFCHLSSLCGWIGVPFGTILGPLLIWLLKKDQFPMVDEHGKEALNFNITITIAALICIPLIFVLIGIFLLLAVAIIHIVFVIKAAIEASNGRSYRYPFALRLIK